MKKIILSAIVSFGALFSASASLYSLGNVNGSGTALNEAIPVDQYPVGVSSTIDVNGAGSSVSFVSVTLNISGGWNGDLYGYLSHNGTMVTLLNFVGTGTGDAFQSSAGFSTSGFNNITLADNGAGGNIHNVANPVSGISYGADGGNFSSFNGLDGNGSWTLFLAANSGPDQSVLQGWSLDMSAVPEPADMALGIFGIVFVSAGVVRWYLTSKKARNQHA